MSATGNLSMAVAQYINHAVCIEKQENQRDS